MPLTVVVGGQFGSEGKGKLVSYLAARDKEGGVAVVRSGGSNAGHTAEANGRRALLRQLPSGAVVDECGLFLAAGMQLELPVLMAEIAELAVSPPRLTIDPNATTIEPADRQAEIDSALRDRLGSTLTGTGAAIARKVMRDVGTRRAAEIAELEPYLDDVPACLIERLHERQHVIVEGTQGFGLSLHHGTFPYVTGRDTTAAAFLSEAGLPVTRVTDVVVVLRTYPIRVAGQSGPLEETTWDTVRRRAGIPERVVEYTTVTGKVRRVGEFDWELAERAVRVNGATAIAVHGLDYLDYRDRGCRSWSELTRTAKRFVCDLEDRLGVEARFVFTGPRGDDLIDRSADGRIMPPAVDRRAA